MTIILDNVSGPDSVGWKALKRVTGFLEEEEIEHWPQFMHMPENCSLPSVLEGLPYGFHIYLSSPQYHIYQILAVNPLILVNVCVFGGGVGWGYAYGFLPVELLNNMDLDWERCF